MEHPVHKRVAIMGVSLREWDPIGIADDSEAQDEYDSYVWVICGMLGRREPRARLIDHLWQMETSIMGLTGDRQQTETIADRLIGRREEIEAKT